MDREWCSEYSTYWIQCNEFDFACSCWYVYMKQSATAPLQIHMVTFSDSTAILTIHDAACSRQLQCWHSSAWAFSRWQFGQLMNAMRFWLSGFTHCAHYNVFLSLRRRCLALCDALQKVGSSRGGVICRGIGKRSHTIMIHGTRWSICFRIHVLVYPICGNA